MVKRFIFIAAIAVLFGVSFGTGLYLKNNQEKAPTVANNPVKKEPGDSGSTKPGKTGSGNTGNQGNTGQTGNTGNTGNTGSGTGGGSKPSTGSGSNVEDKTRYSWWFTRNSNHKPVTVESLFRQLIRGKGFYLADTSKKRVYLTFDEGYENGYTASILDSLKANNVKAAFFVTQSYVEKNPTLVKRMAAEGHIIGNHTATHPSMPGISSAKIREELATVKTSVKNLTGKTTTFMRPPMGEFNGRVLDIARGQGYYTIFWSMAYKDWDTKNQPGAAAALKHVTDNVHPGAIILLHAVSSSNTEAMDDILKNLKSMGYSFGSLNELK